MRLSWLEEFIQDAGLRWIEFKAKGVFSELTAS
jgi:hypothetical protein